MLYHIAFDCIIVLDIKLYYDVGAQAVKIDPAHQKAALQALQSC